MKILIDVETIKGVFSYRGPIRIRFKVASLLGSSETP